MLGDQGVVLIYQRPYRLKYRMGGVAGALLKFRLLPQPGEKMMACRQSF
ncbi:MULTISPECIES: hypothetical protein [Citrobacter]|nr:MULTISPECIES: hypothetical protein [Citrobacter]MDE9710228.1 hypothetical protein [Citrobacter portucalensis]MDM2815444.1 hypothetical protein [Citrobacter sp. Cpo102]MDM2853537.1 hypothetical protein [Citrobacter sp. Cpo065]MDT7472258.1 hypothetical protein [Citrobacter portucalensis]MEB6523419.1 hypothetical protein [Citrobacter portucalensis]